MSREDMMSDLPEHAMMLEQNRQLCVQNERLENLLLQLLDEVEALRAEVAQANGRPAPASQPGERTERDRSSEAPARPEGSETEGPEVRTEEAPR